MNDELKSVHTYMEQKVADEVSGFRLKGKPIEEHQLPELTSFDHEWLNLLDQIWLAHGAESPIYQKALTMWLRSAGKAL